MVTVLVVFLVIISLITGLNGKEIDSSGYILYCPCMGRFGNQADHFLGALSFAKSLNRTLVVPPWIEYKKGQRTSIQVPYRSYFDLDVLKDYHRTIAMEEFMKDIAPAIWPSEKRISFCYMERKSLNPDNIEPGCYPKDGNPFGPFWDTYDVDFIRSEFFGPLHYDIHHSNIAEKWSESYPSSEWPILAFTGAPASFPVQDENRELQEYVKWNQHYANKAAQFIRETLPKGAFIGIHLRNGVDWIRACEHVKSSNHLFASPQCLGYNNEKGQLYMELCMPTKEIIIRQIKRLIKKVKETNKSNEIKSIFVASDNNHMINDLNDALQRMKVNAFKLSQDNPHLDLVILGMANHFIGNCISSYSAFVKRERDIKGFPTYFWAYPKEKMEKKLIKHEEL